MVEGKWGRTLDFFLYTPCVAPENVIYVHFSAPVKVPVASRGR